MRIGSSPSCDIVLNSGFVSSFHAEIFVLDNGEIILVDKNSKNGTFVGTRRIDPNTEVTIRRGDYVRIADVDLPWNRIPQAPDPQQYKSIVSIGSNFHNTLALSNTNVSRFHATLKVDKKGHAAICDKHSTNGTKLNGQRLTPGRDYPVKRGDVVIVAEEDITAQIQQYLPATSNVVKIVAGVLCACLIAALGWFVYPFFFGGSKPDSSTVVYVHTAYHYKVVARTPFGEVSFNYPDLDDNGQKAYSYASGTAFFLDKEGRLGTARHLVKPWAKEYVPEEERDAVELAVKSWMVERIFSCSTPEDLERLKRSTLGQFLVNGVNDEYELNQHVRQLLAAPIEITGGELDFIAVGYNGHQYLDISEFKRCDVLGDSNDAEKDVAIIQLNDKATPSSVKGVFDLKKVSDKIDIKPMNNNLRTIGFPYGFLWAKDSHSKKIESNQRITSCSKEPGRYTFELQATSQGGASGSPIFKEDGTLVGVLSATRIGDNGPTLAAHAKFLKDLYEEVTLSIAK